MVLLLLLLVRGHGEVKVQRSVHAQLVLDDLLKRNESSINDKFCNLINAIIYLIHIRQLPLERVNVQSQVVQYRLIVQRLHELSH